MFLSGRSPILSNNYRLINCLPQKPDIIAVTEIKPENLLGMLSQSEFNLDGYTVFCHGLNDMTDAMHTADRVHHVTKFYAYGRPYA